MALKQLMLNKKLEQRKAEMSALEQRAAELKTRSEELEAVIEDAKTDEEISAVEEQIGALDADSVALETEKATLTGAIAELEGELEVLNENKPKNSSDGKRSEIDLKKGNYAGMTREERVYLGRMDIRECVRESLEKDEVRSFYETLRDTVMKKRALTETDLLIPELVMNRIQIIVGDYGVLYREVDVIPLNGTARIVLDGANPEAIWVEMCDPVQELASSFKAVELDGYKVGGYIPVCNAILEDSMINLAMYVERKLAIAIAKALDKAILNGTGATGKQPLGIIPNLAAANAVTLDDSNTGGIFGSLFSNIGLIDTGENDVGEIIAVMKRATYYSSIAPRLVIVNSGGTYTLPNINAPTFAGMRVVFSQYMAAGTALVGDFKKYVLGERAGVKLASSTDVRFIEDQTVFKGTARYDGKPVNLDDTSKTADWILATIPGLPENP